MTVGRGPNPATASGLGRCELVPGKYKCEDVVWTFDFGEGQWLFRRKLGVHTAAT